MVGECPEGEGRVFFFFYNPFKSALGTEPYVGLYLCTCATESVVPKMCSTLKRSRTRP